MKVKKKKKVGGGWGGECYYYCFQAQIIITIRTNELGMIFFSFFLESTALVLWLANKRIGKIALITGH